MDANSVTLSKAIGEAYPQAEQPFLQSWRQHIGFLRRLYPRQSHQRPSQNHQAKSGLDGYRTSFGQLIHSVIPELPADAVAQELIPHVDTVFTTIDSLVTNDNQVYANLSTAAAHMAMTAAVLAGSIAENKHLS